MAKKGPIKKSVVSRTHNCEYVAIITSMDEALKNLTEKIDKTSSKIDMASEKIGAAVAQIDDIKKRLFVDNGTPSIQSRLTLNENLIKDLNKKVSDIEEDMNIKLDDIKQMPKSYVLYTVGLIMFLGTIISGIIWLIKHA